MWQNQKRNEDDKSKKRNKREDGKNEVVTAFTQDLWPRERMERQKKKQKNRNKTVERKTKKNCAITTT